ncbi:tRNA (adenosine(37)-N6)-threonylcarbamoyltransferase complex ATPase subunit type 1 TsaE [Flavimarina sp. Hel_I_48]|uniref:tRNA (adenosine(37)-N6)-threonylcarbamoyltransferase complex ATPase subunit type 1 TsaE n=1 Tax=Flavimarina sp. Hel_I_48 TaxID=1392488 RepID=UPI0004DF31C6|nr:tRNA (adenosine(37)-N6)-threonylcarbamoyltransferase complex ATPase subunit type 1 TsaE [Flavimarina sp. Hel_I_48]
MEITYTLAEIDQVAKNIIAYCKHKTILFEGEMGAGKTTLIKSIVKNLGSLDSVSSPTFSIVNEYRDKNELPIYHFDFYRIEDSFEVGQLGLDDYFGQNCWTLIEWPQKINTFLPKPSHTVKLNSINNVKRMLTVS